MSLKIIGAGFGRTGTLSTCQALNELGFPCYHMFEVLENKANKTHLDFWNRVAESPAGKQHNWEEVFKNYTATVDNPSCCVWRELVQAYPDAKVILTLHPKGAETWFESTLKTIYMPEYIWQFKVLRWVPKVRKMTNMTHKLIWQRSHKGTMPNKEAAIARYHEHMEEVKAAVPKEKLLIFTADQGWEPLCQFLGVPAPEKEFPNVNDRVQLQKAISKISRIAYLMLVFALLVVLGIGYSVLKYLN